MGALMVGLSLSLSERANFINETHKKIKGFEREGLSREEAINKALDGNSDIKESMLRVLNEQH